MFGTHKIHTTTYHPQANGLVERFHRHLKSAFRAVGDSKDWSRHLPWVLLEIRSAIKEDIGFSASQILYGQSLRLPGEFVADDRPADISATITSETA